MASRVISGCLNYTFQQFSSVRSLPTRLVEGGNGSIGASGGPEVFGTLGLQQIRFRMKDYFRRPNEKKRIAKHGWKKRMSTPAGRMVIMRRLLKGRHVLTH